MKTILISLDYEPSAQNVAEAGYNLAKAMNAQIILLHVTSNATYYSSPNYSPIMGFENVSSIIQQETTEQLINIAQKYLDKSKEHLGDETIQTIVQTGDYGDAILSTANDLQVDIIVLGTHSRRRLERILLGSVAEKVLHYSLIPLFIIPTRSMEDN